MSNGFSWEQCISILSICDYCLFVVPKMRYVIISEVYSLYCIFINVFQIYIARIFNGQQRTKGNLSNQTVMHTIYKRPFNYPDSRKPVVVAESVLTQCWDEDATTQVSFFYTLVYICYSAPWCRCPAV